MQSQNLRGFDLNGIGNGSVVAAAGSSIVASSKNAAAAERVMEEAVDAAILSRKATEPDKWAMVENSKLHHPAGNAVNGAVHGMHDGGSVTAANGIGGSTATAAGEGAKGSPSGGGGRCVFD